MWRKTAQSFQRIAERLKKSAVGPGPSRPSSEVIRQSELDLEATKIRFKIRQTSQKVDHLAKLAKRIPVSNNPTTEILELTTEIKKDIAALNSAVEALELLSHQGGDASVTTSYSTFVVAGLKSQLSYIIEEFEEVLAKRTEETANPFVREGPLAALAAVAAVDASRARRPMLTEETANPFVRQRPLAALADGAAVDASIVQHPLWSNRSSPSPLFPRKPGDGESQPLLPQNQQQQQQLVPLQDRYMESRAEGLTNVGSTIREVRSVYNQLATAVSQQRQRPIRIDDNMDDTLARGEGALGALLKYLNGMSSDAWFKIKILFVLIFFLIVFRFFLA